MTEKHLRESLAAYSRQQTHLVSQFASRRVPDVPVWAVLRTLDCLLNVPVEEVKAAMNAARKARGAADDSLHYASSEDHLPFEIAQYRAAQMEG